MTTVSDTFTQSDGALSSPWLNESTGYSVVSNRARVGGGGANRSLWYDAVLGQDQYSQGYVYNIPTTLGGGDHEGPGLAVRFGKSSWPGGDWNQAYHVLVMTNKLSLFKGFFSLLQTVNTTTADGDLIRIEASGTGTVNILVKRNGTTIIDYDDSSSPYDSANHVYPGMTSYTNGNNEIDNWEAGDLPSDVEIPIGVGSTTFTTYAPTPSIDSGPISIPISVGSVATTTYDLSADVGSSASIPIGSGSQQFTTYAESLNIGFGIPEGTGPEAAFPDDTNVGITGYAVTVDSNYNIGIATGSVTSTGYIPSADSGQGTFISIDVGAITTTGYAPVDVSSHVPSPSTATQTITGYVPLIGTSHFRTPNTGAVTITGYDVSLTPTTDIYIDISSGAITSASSAPSLIRGTGRAPDAATLGFTGYTPDAISEDVSWEFFPDEGSATYSTYDLTLSIIEVHKSIPIAVGSLVIPGWKLPFGTEPSVEVGARKRRKILGFLK